MRLNQQRSETHKYGRQHSYEGNPSSKVTPCVGKLAGHACLQDSSLNERKMKGLDSAIETLMSNDHLPCR